MERIGNILKILAISAAMLLLGIWTGNFLFRYSTAESAAGSPADRASDVDMVRAEGPTAAAESDTADAVRPTVSESEFNRMILEIRREVNRFGGQSAIYIKNLETGKDWSWNADRAFPSASLIKVPIMIGVYEKINKGDLSLDRTLTLTRAARRSGSGHLKWRRNGEQFTVGELLEQMISVSDNIAQEMLIQTVGLDYLRDRFSTFGVKRTNITRGGLSLASRTNVENYTTAKDMSILLEHLYRGRKFGSKASEEMIDLMKGVKYHDRLPKRLPAGWTIAHKTGLLRRACHDVGIVYSPAGDYIICVLTSNAPSYRIAKRYIAQVGSITFKYFNKPGTAVATTTTTTTGSLPLTGFKSAS